MDFGVQNSGFVLKRLADIRRSLRNRLIETFGEQINLTDDSNFSQVVDVFAGETSEVWEGAALVYAAFDVDSAFGVALDNLAQLAGVVRAPAVASSGSLVFTGVQGALIPEGTLVRAPALNLSVETTQAAMIGVSGSVVVPARALETGPLAFAQNTLTQLVNSILGVASVNNPVAFVAGVNAQTDVELRQAIRNVPATFDNNAAARIRSVDGVLEAFAFSNRGDAVDGFGFPPKSLNLIVWPSSIDADYRERIARALLLAAPAGIAFSGDVEVTITDAFGYNELVKFRFAQVVDIHVNVDLTTNANYPLNGDEQIEESIEAYINALNVGNDVRQVDLYASIQHIAGVVDVLITLKAGSTPDPTDVATIAISPLEIARCDAANITVTST